MKNIIKMDLFNEDKLILSKKIDLNKWYDGDIVEIDSDEYRSLNNISTIKGTQYNQEGIIEESWANYYDKMGRLIKIEKYDSSFKLIDIEEIKYDENGDLIP